MFERETLPADPQAAVLVCLDFGELDHAEGVEELVRLVESAGVNRHCVVGGRRERPDPKLFVGRGRCELCHSGPDFTDGEFHNVGLPVLAGLAADRGRAQGIRELKTNPFNAAGRYSDRPHGEKAKRLAFLPTPTKDVLGAFKTPSLRNVARTAPYLHDGRFATLRQVVQFYADGRKASHGRLIGEREGTLDLIAHFTPSEVADLVAFLKTLNSAPLPPALTEQPAHP